MAFDVNEIRSNLEFGGARPTQFDVLIVPNNPALISGLEKLQFMCRAAAIPSATIGVIDVPYFGRKIKVAGDRTFEDWPVTIINDEDFLIRNAMEKWVSFINSARQNLASSNFPIDYKGTAIVNQYSKIGTILRTYKFDGIFPNQVTSIDLDWAATDTIEEFQVNFVYDYNIVESGTTGNLPLV